MRCLANSLRRLLSEGRIVLSARPDDAGANDAEAVNVLERAFHEYCLTLAGPPLAFDAATAVVAARFVAWSAWYLVSRGEPDTEVERHLVLPEPATPGQHLSADLVLRYVPQIHRRAARANPADTLTRRLDETLRRWPLSGVLADLTDGPLTALDFGGHHGILLLYAERLADHFKPSWVPPPPARAYVELVWQERGMPEGILDQ